MSTVTPTRSFGTRAIARPADKMAVRSVGLLGKALSTLAGLFEGLFSAPPKPPSHDQQHQSAMAATEAERLAAFRQYVGEQTRQSLAANSQIDRDQQQQRTREDEHDRAARRSRDAPARDGPER
jgi:hypothetical protein